MFTIRQQALTIFYQIFTIRWLVFNIDMDFLIAFSIVCSYLPGI